MATKSIKPEFEEYTRRIKAFAKELELRQQDLADSAGVKRPTIASYIGQESQPSMKTLESWVKSFGLNGHWLLTGEGEMLAPGTMGSGEKEEDPFIRRVQKIRKELEELEASPEVIQKAILNLTESHSEEEVAKKKAS